MKYIRRLTVLPFLLIIALLYSLYQLRIIAKNFMLHGGEIIAYPEPHTKIADVYNELKQQQQTHINQP